jgi:hypothetical protein
MGPELAKTVVLSVNKELVAASEQVIVEHLFPKPRPATGL